MKQVRALRARQECHVVFRVTALRHRQLRVFAARRGMTVSAVMRDLVDRLFPSVQWVVDDDLWDRDKKVGR